MLSLLVLAATGDSRGLGLHGHLGFSDLCLVIAAVLFVIAFVMRAYVWGAPSGAGPRGVTAVNVAALGLFFLALALLLA